MSQNDETEISAKPEGPATRSEADTSIFSGEDVEPTVEPVSPPSGDDALETARKEAAENYERFVRAKADYENVVKRHQRELADRARYDGESLARDILSSVDDLERALEHAADAAVSGGVELVLKGLVAALKRNGVERIDAQGKPFDPSEHEAVTMVETDEFAPNTVVAVFRPGYRMRDRLLRAAMVSVSKPAEGKTTAQA
jgi:molecular chaperone GrpE